jgi:hypothetical protein
VQGRFPGLTCCGSHPRNASKLIACMLALQLADARAKLDEASKHLSEMGAR